LPHATISTGLASHYSQVPRMNRVTATDLVLDSQLNAAIKYFQHDLKIGACIHLSGFDTQVQPFLQVGRLTQGQASQLLQGLQSVESVAGC
jgi:hypothetical protein